MALRSALAVAAFAAASAGPVSAAVVIDWDRTASIKDAAGRLGKLHGRQGSVGVLKFLDACYKTHLLSSTYNQSIEACLAQDYMHAKVLARIYAKVPDDLLKQRSLPSPELISNSMQQRLVTTFKQYALTPDEAAEFQKLVETHGVPEFIKAVFPKRGSKSAPSPKAN